MKHILLSIFILLACSLSAQIVRTDYFLGTSINRRNFNPALTPEQGYIVVPVLPTLSAGVETNTLNLDHLTFKKNGERVNFMSPLVTSEEFMKGIKSSNFAQADVTYKIFGIGFYKKDKFFSLDINLRAHANATLPRSVFSLLKDGFNNEGDTYYDLSKVRAYAQSFVEVGLGYSMPLFDNNLSIGVRPKFILGVGYADLDGKEIQIEATDRRWRAKSSVSLDIAFPGIKPKYNEDDGLLDGFDTDFNGVPGYGFGVDLGANYNLGHVVPVLEGLNVSFAIRDIGFISWTKSNSLQMYSSESEVIVEPSTWDTDYSDKSLDKVLEDAFNDLKDAVNLHETGVGSKGKSTSLRSSFTLGAEYAIMDKKLTFGVLYNAFLSKYYTSNALMGSVAYTPSRWLGLATSYTLAGGDYANLGFALYLTPSKGVTFHVASDYIFPRVNSSFYPTTSKALNVQVGFSIPLGRRVN